MKSVCYKPNLRWHMPALMTSKGTANNGVKQLIDCWRNKTPQRGFWPACLVENRITHKKSRITHKIEKKLAWTTRGSSFTQGFVAMLKADPQTSKAGSALTLTGLEDRFLGLSQKHKEWIHSQGVSIKPKKRGLRDDHRTFLNRHSRRPS